MKSLLLVALFAVCAVSVLALPMMALETSAKSRAPIGWTRVRSFDPSDRMKVQIAIKQSNIDRLEVCFTSTFFSEAAPIAFFVFLRTVRVFSFARPFSPSPTPCSQASCTFSCSPLPCKHEKPGTNGENSLLTTENLLGRFES